MYKIVLRQIGLIVSTYTRGFFPQGESPIALSFILLIPAVCMCDVQYFHEPLLLHCTAGVRLV